MQCEGGTLVNALGSNHRRYVGAFDTINLGMQRLSAASLGALTAACECASLSARGSSQSVGPNAGRA